MKLLVKLIIGITANPKSRFTRFKRTNGYQGAANDSNNKAHDNDSNSYADDESKEDEQ